MKYSWYEFWFHFSIIIYCDNKKINKYVNRSLECLKTLLILKFSKICITYPDF